MKEKQKELDKKHSQQLCEIHESTENQLYIAISNNNLQVVIEELDGGFDVNSKLSNDYSLLFLAASYGHFDIINELVNRGADINVNRGIVFIFC